MKRSSSFIKRKIALFLVLLLSIESFAAVVGDNDGAAFITKAEFDSLKNDFQSQLDRYNSSLDNKIDGAIASYLSGIKINAKKNITPLISNYKDICWIADYKLYGKIKKWQDPTTLSYTSSAYEWLDVPNETRRNMRDGRIDANITGYIFGQTAMILSLELTTGNHAFASVTQWNTTSEERKNAGPPVLHLTLKNDTSALILSGDNRPWYNEIQTNSVSYNRPMWRSDAVNGEDAYGNNYPSDYIIDLNTTAPITFNAPDNTYAINFKLNGTFPITGAEAHVTWRLRPSALATQIPFTNWQIGSTNFDYYWPLATLAPRNTSNMGTKYFDTGVSFLVTTDNYHQQCGRLLNNALLGTDKSIVSNVSRYVPNDYYSGVLRHYTDKAKYDTVPMNCTSLKYTCIPQHLGGSYPNRAVQYFTSMAVPAQLNLFYFEKATLSQIENPSFKYNGHNLKLGAGMPLLIDSQFSGDLSISFDYGINRIISTKDPNENEIKLSVRKSSFDSNDNGKIVDYWTGTLNNSDCSLMNQVVDNDEKKVDIVIEDIKEGDDVWLRLAPTITDGGYYANISNLKMTMEVK